MVKAKNVLVLTYWSYPDGLIQGYTLPYLRIIRKNLPAGSMIYLLTQEKDEEIPIKDRKKIEEHLRMDGVAWIPVGYRPFGFGSILRWVFIFIRVSVLIVTRRISVIHCWCTPAGALGYLFSVVLRRPLIIDSYEPHAEAMVENGTWKPGGLAFRLLFWLEKKQTKRAIAVIAAAKGMSGYASRKYHITPKSYFVKPACVDMNLFSVKERDASLLRELEMEHKTVCVYAGKFGGIYFDKEVFDFFKEAVNHWGDSFRVLLLTTHSRSEIEKYCRESGVDPSIVKSRFVEYSEVPRYLRLADFAITPVKPVPTKQYCTPIKDGEYWAMGLPVVITPNISDDSALIEENNAGAVLHGRAYLDAIQRIDKLLQEPRNETAARIRTLAAIHRNFDIAERVYREVYSGIS